MKKFPLLLIISMKDVEIKYRLPNLEKNPFIDTKALVLITKMEFVQIFGRAQEVGGWLGYLYAYCQ